MAIIGDGSGALTKKERRLEVKMMLRAALTDMHVKMTSDRDYDSVGLDYTDRFASYLEVLSAMSLLPWHQRVALVQNLGEERATQDVIAARLGVKRRQTVSEYISAALDDMCERIYRNLPDKPDKPDIHTRQNVV